MKRVIVSILIVFGACNGGDKPHDLIPKEKMASILIDIHLAEAYTENAKLKKDTIFSFYKDLEQKNFERHGVDSSSFRKSYDYYARNIKDLDQIYEWVVDTLNSEQAALRASSQPEN